MTNFEVLRAKCSSNLGLRVAKIVLLKSIAQLICLRINLALADVQMWDEHITANAHKR